MRKVATFYEIPYGSWTRSGRFFTVSPAAKIQGTNSMPLVTLPSGAKAFRDKQAGTQDIEYIPLVAGQEQDLRSPQFTKVLNACLRSGAVIRYSESTKQTT